MIRYKINNSKAFIPLQISKGTAEQRFQKARFFNLKFYDELQYCLKDKEVAPRTFIQKLRNIAEGKLGINIHKAESIQDSKTRYILNSNATAIGYNLELPLSYYTKNIQENNARTFLKETQTLFNEAFNPKILYRFLALVNSGCKVDSIMEFYKKNITKTSTLTTEALNKFLEKKSNEEKINTLQFLRYKLLSEINTANATYQIDRRIEKHNNLIYKVSPDYYNLDKYHYEEKKNLVVNEIYKLIKAQ